VPFVVVAGHRAGGEYQRGQSDRHVDVEQPAPVGAVQDQAADDRSEDRREGHRRGDDADQPADPPRPGDPGDEGLPGGLEQPSTKTLKDAEGDQRAGRRGQAAEGGPEDEDGHRDEPGPLAAHTVDEQT
jgi:hypothetical protein